MIRPLWYCVHVHRQTIKLMAAIKYSLHVRVTGIISHIPHNRKSSRFGEREAHNLLFLFQR